MTTTPIQIDLGCEAAIAVETSAEALETQLSRLDRLHNSAHPGEPITSACDEFAEHYNSIKRALRALRGLTV